MRSKPGTQPAKPPDAASLQAAALTHLARYAATEAGLTQVLRRKIDRWARQSEAEPDSIAQTTALAKSAVKSIVSRLAESGAVSDAAFAQSRARSLARAGRSRRAIGAHLAAKGVPAEMASDAAPHDAAQEQAAALIHARKRRLGPWRKAEASPDIARRELASLARAGFAHGVAAQALKMPLDDAEAAIIVFRADL